MPKAKFELPDELNKAIVTCKFRASYAHLFEPWTGDDTKTPRYSVQMIIPKDDPWVKKARRFIVKIAVASFGPNAGRLMRKGQLKDPFRDGDLEREGDEVYEGAYFVNANGARAGKTPPGVYTGTRKDIRQMASPEEQFFSGCYARAEVKFYPFNEAGGKGIACYLFRVQRMAMGQPLAGGPPVEQVFDEVEEEDEGIGFVEDEAEDEEDDIF